MWQHLFFPEKECLLKTYSPYPSKLLAKKTALGQKNSEPFSHLKTFVLPQI